MLPLRLGLWDAAQDHRAAILEQVALAMSHDPSSALGVGTGWSSAKDFLERPKMGALREHIRQCLPWVPWQIDAWANVMKSGDQVRAHNHGLSHRGGRNEWAGVHFVEVPDRGPPLIVHLDGVPMPIVARETLTVVFPADVAHEVPSHMFDGRRVSVAFSARHLEDSR